MTLRIFVVCLVIGAVVAAPRFKWRRRNTVDTSCSDEAYVDSYDGDKCPFTETSSSLDIFNTAGKGYNNESFFKPKNNTQQNKIISKVINIAVENNFSSKGINIKDLDKSNQKSTYINVNKYSGTPSPYLIGGDPTDEPTRSQNSAVGDFSQYSSIDSLFTTNITGVGNNYHSTHPIIRGEKDTISTGPNIRNKNRTSNAILVKVNIVNPTNNPFQMKGSNQIPTVDGNNAFSYTTASPTSNTEPSGNEERAESDTIAAGIVREDEPSTTSKSNVGNLSGTNQRKKGKSYTKINIGIKNDPFKPHKEGNNVVPAPEISEENDLHLSRSVSSSQEISGKNHFVPYDLYDYDNLISVPDNENSYDTPSVETRKGSYFDSWVRTLNDRI